VANLSANLTVFRTRLLLLLALVLLPEMGLVVYSNLQQRQTEKEAARETAVALSRLAAAYHESYVKNTRQLLATLNELQFFVLSTNRAFCESNFVNLRRLLPDYLNFGLIETNGTLFCSAEPGKGPVNLKDRSYFQRVLQTRDFAMGDFQIGRLTGQPALNFGYPVMDEKGRLRRVIYASLKLSLLSQAMTRLALPVGGSVLVVDQNGTVLAREPEPEKWVGRSLSDVPVVRQMLQQKSGTMEMPGIDGASGLHAITPLGDGRTANFFVSVGIPSAVSFAQANRVLVRNLLLFAATGLFVLLVARSYAFRYFLRPINSLALAARQVAEGNLTARVKLAEGTGELVQLGQAFDDMTERLQGRQRELAAANQKITTLNQDLEKRVKERTSQLEAANGELEAFSYSVSHDLRAPLRHIRGFADFLVKEAGPQLSSDAARYLGHIEDSARQMDDLIENLLSFSRMSRAEMHLTKVNLGDVVQEARKSFDEELARRDVEWVIGTLPTVRADPALMRTVFTNLLGNALKYSRDSKPAKVEVTSQSFDSEHIVCVRDNGVGFDMQYAHKLFGVFQRLHDCSEFDGTGIGLANVKRVILRHGGRVWGEGNEGHGAAFYFTLPRGIELENKS